MITYMNVEWLTELIQNCTRSVLLEGVVVLDGIAWAAPLYDMTHEIHECPRPI